MEMKRLNCRRVFATVRCLPAAEGIAPCPRCNSQDTKFCYFNNYNIKQPRYFCRVSLIGRLPPDGSTPAKGSVAGIETSHSCPPCACSSTGAARCSCQPCPQTCQRYWTEGGVLRDVPPGAGRRKSKSGKGEAPAVTTSVGRAAAAAAAADTATAGMGPAAVSMPLPLLSGMPGVLPQLPFLDPALAAFTMANVRRDQWQGSVVACAGF